MADAFAHRPPDAGTAYGPVDAGAGDAGPPLRSGEEYDTSGVKPGTPMPPGGGMRSGEIWYPKGKKASDDAGGGYYGTARKGRGG